jgi:hypothetical protein
MTSDATLHVLSATLRNQQQILDTSTAFPVCKRHINVLELEAILLGLKKFKDLINRQSLLILSDNQSSVFAIKKGRHSNPIANKMIKEIYCFLNFPAKVWIAYIPTKENVLADQLSRPGNEDWALDPAILQGICQEIDFQPQLELFAQEHNHLLPRFVSSTINRRALAWDAFSFQWSTGDLYANPPFSLIPRVLAKAVSERANLLMIVPEWPSAPWFPLLAPFQTFRLPRLPHMFTHLGEIFDKPRWNALAVMILHHRKGEPVVLRSQPHLARGVESFPDLTSRKGEDSAPRSAVWM